MPAMSTGLHLTSSILIFPTDPDQTELYTPEDAKHNSTVAVNEPFISALHWGDSAKGTKLRGYIHYPQLPDNSACRNSTHAPPANVLPDDGLNRRGQFALGLAPWDPDCNKEILKAANDDGASIEGFIFYTPDHMDALPGSGDEYWKDLGVGGYRFPIFAIRGSDGTELMETYLKYADPNKTVAYDMSKAVSNGPGPQPQTGQARLFARIETGPAAKLPGLWMFLLIVLGGLVLLIVSTSLAMHILQYRRRKSLRRRVASGEVDLEALGIKRLLLPRKELDKIPLRTYVSSPGQSSTESAATTESTDKSTPATSTTPMPAPPPPVFSAPATASPLFAAPDPPLPPSPSLTPCRIPSHELPPNSELYDQPACSICLDDFISHVTTVRELRCGHIFHPACIDSFLENQSSLCPLCKKSSLSPGYVPAHLTNAMVRRERQMRRRAARERRVVQGGWVGLFLRLGIVRRVDVGEEVEMRQAAAAAAAATAARHTSHAVAHTSHESTQRGEERSGKWRRAVSTVFPGFQ